jgi:hypothetical protein
MWHILSIDQACREPSKTPSYKPKCVLSNEPHEVLNNHYYHSSVTPLPTHQHSSRPSGEPSTVQRHNPSKILIYGLSIVHNSIPRDMPNGIRPSNESDTSPTFELGLSPSLNLGPAPRDEPNTPSGEPGGKCSLDATSSGGHSTIQVSSETPIPRRILSKIPCVSVPIDDKPSVFPRDKSSVAPSDEPTAIQHNEPAVTLLCKYPRDIPNNEPSLHPIKTQSMIPSEDPSKNPRIEPKELPGYGPFVQPKEKPSFNPRHKHRIVPSNMASTVLVFPVTIQVSSHTLFQLINLP